MEDLNLYLKDVLTERPHTRVGAAKSCHSFLHCDAVFIVLLVYGRMYVGRRLAGD